jgi:hypothetical protein
MGNGTIRIKCQRFVITNGSRQFPYLLGALDPKVLESVAIAPSFEDDTPHKKLAAEVLDPPAEHWQRPLIQKKVDAIASNFDRSMEIMPNPVLLALIPGKKITVEKEILANGAETDLWIVEIPSIEVQPKSLWIIDGQHRVKGLSKTKETQSLLPFVLLYSADDVYKPETLAKIFAQVTTEATPLEAVHKAWMQFVFKLGDYSDNSPTWRAMCTVALLCKTQSFLNVPNRFYNSIGFNPRLIELGEQGISPGGFSYTAVELAELLNKHFYKEAGGKYLNMTEEQVATEISLAVDALVSVAKGKASESAFFAKNRSEQKYFRDGYIVGILAYLKKHGAPDDWQVLLKKLNFHKTDWSDLDWIETTSGRSGSISKSVANACFEKVFGDACLPEGTQDMFDLFQGSNAKLTIEYAEVSEDEKVKKSSKVTHEMELVHGRLIDTINLKANQRWIKIKNNSSNVGTFKFNPQGIAAELDLDPSVFRNGRIFTIEEIRKLKKAVKLIVVSELYGGVLHQKTLQIKFDA